MHSRHHHPNKEATGSHGPTTGTKPVVSTTDEGHRAHPITAETIRLRAFQNWEIAGKPDGDGIQFWLAAEKDLTQGK